MTLQEKALAVIEGLCLVGDPKSLHSPLDDIYKYAHIARRDANHNEGCSHNDWEKELNEMYDFMVRMKVIS
jgi:hypothetical protein